MDKIPLKVARVTLICPGMPPGLQMRGGFYFSLSTHRLEQSRAMRKLESLISI